MSNIRYGLRTINSYQHLGGQVRPLIEGKSGVNFLLTKASNATVAYSLRKLNPNYTGNCIKVRRTSDNSELDIGFVNDYIDTSSLSSFVGSSDGRVSAWYDQSGNNNHIYQSTGNAQPLIIQSGTLLMYNNKVFIYFIPYTSFNITALNGKSFLDQYFVTSPLGDTIYLYPVSGGNFGYCAQTTNTLAKGYSSNSKLFANSQEFLGTTRSELYYFINGYKLVEHRNASTINWTAYNFAFYQPTNTYSFSGYLQELVAFDNDTTQVENDIRDDINSFYGIY